MERQVEKLKHLVADILDVARINAGGVELRHETTDLRSAVEHAIETEQHGITAARLDLSTSLRRSRFGWKAMPSDSSRSLRICWTTL